MRRSKNWVERSFKALKWLSSSLSGCVLILPENHRFSELIESLKLNQVHFHCHIVKLLNQTHWIILFDGHLEDSFAVISENPQLQLLSVAHCLSTSPDSFSLLSEKLRQMPLRKLVGKIERSQCDVIERMLKWKLETWFLSLIKGYVFRQTSVSSSARWEASYRLGICSSKFGVQTGKCGNWE